MASANSSSPARDSPAQVVLRNTLRYTISAKEYKTLHQYLITRSPPIVQKRAPLPQRFDAIVRNKDDYNAAAIRASLRVFLATQSGLKLWDIILTQIRGRGKTQKYVGEQEGTQSLLTSNQYEAEDLYPQIP